MPKFFQAKKQKLLYVKKDLIYKNIIDASIYIQVQIYVN